MSSIWEEIFFVDLTISILSWRSELKKSRILFVSVWIGFGRLLSPQSLYFQVLEIRQEIPLKGRAGRLNFWLRLNCLFPIIKPPWFSESCCVYVIVNIQLEGGKSSHWSQYIQIQTILNLKMTPSSLLQVHCQVVPRNLGVISPRPEVSQGWFATQWALLCFSIQVAPVQNPPGTEMVSKTLKTFIAI